MHILYTGGAKIKKKNNNSGAKRLISFSDGVTLLEFYLYQSDVAS